MHPQRMTWRQLTSSLRAGRLKEVIFRCYALANGYALHHLDRVFAWPSFLQRKPGQTKKKYESFQTEKGMQRLLKNEGFVGVQFVRDRHFVVMAGLPSLMKDSPTNAPRYKGNLPVGTPQTVSPEKPIPETLN